MKSKRFAIVSIFAVVIISVLYFSDSILTDSNHMTESSEMTNDSGQDAGNENSQSSQAYAASVDHGSAGSDEDSIESITSSVLMAEDNVSDDASGLQEKSTETGHAETAPESQVQPKTYTASVSRGATRTSDIYLMKGDENSKVTELQKNLKTLGYFTVTPTGYFGDITVAAVKKLQKQHALKQDGIVYDSTLELINKLLKEKEEADKAAAKKAESETAQKKPEPENVSGSGKKAEDYMVSWFGGAENILKRGSTATVYDIRSGKSFKIKRSYGTNHADCETLTGEDTKIMKQIYGGQWSWERRPVIVIVNGQKIAASMAGMPHAGSDKDPAEAYVTWRSGGYGAGTNLDAVKGNGMDGHFDIHFLNSRTHGTNRVNPDHQKAVKEAAKWAEENY